MGRSNKDPNESVVQAIYHHVVVAPSRLVAQPSKRALDGTTRTEPMTPNPSVEARPNGKPRRPRGAFVYHAPHGQRAFPSASPHLER